MLPRAHCAPASPWSAAAWKSSTARLVLGDAAPGRVHDAEVAPCGGMALVRRRLAELHRARLALGDAASGRVHVAEGALCAGVALVRRRLEGVHAHDAEVPLCVAPHPLGEKGDWLLVWLLVASADQSAAHLARGARGLVMQLLAGVFRLVCVCTIVCTRVRKMGRRVHCAAAACVAARAAMDARARRAERKSSGTVVGTPSRWKSEFVRDLASWGTF